MEQMTIVERNISDLIPAEYNPRQLTERQYSDLRASLERFGCVDPVIVNKHPSRLDVIVGGHQRLRVWQDIGHATIPTVEVMLDLEKERELNIRLNRNQGEWDFDVLGNNFQFDELLSWGFEEAELGMDTSPEEVTEDTVPDPPAHPVVTRGQLWLCGKHRILCGDAESAEDMGRLLDGAKPLLCVTDPPYGVKYDPKWRQKMDDTHGGQRSGTITGDNSFDWTEAFKLFPGDVLYAWHGDRGGLSIDCGAQVRSAGFVIRSRVVWRKPQFVVGRGHYHYQHESAWYAVRKGSKAHWIGDRTQSTIWDIPLKDSKEKTDHVSQKPVECMARAIRNHKGDVYDPFCGVGASVIACEQLGRSCYAADIDPLWVEVTLRRWAAFTGHVPRLESGETLDSLKPAEIS